ncbi:uncharacterized protein KD926_000067 [Aspergillus affinis]|uniref:uncharacterized protein n=1 Tax=Aspergillus affinis TaxID=1070780 RepID=UPI0022FDD07C|nr:uncharacterized protein KD926_000067 [Aspergillus affinis]KAI9037726.1 hypothetical protein KD926_000067 [Aspergillus affinis]
MLYLAPLFWMGKLKARFGADQDPSRTPSVVAGPVTISENITRPYLRWLGILFDKKLSFKYHVKEMAPIAIIVSREEPWPTIRPVRTTGYLQEDQDPERQGPAAGRYGAALDPCAYRKVLRIYEGLSKPQTSIIIQMRTMRIGLRHFLFKIKQVDSDRCGCELGSQTPKHVLMECSLHLAGRRIMMERLDSIEGLRGRIQDCDAVMNHPQAIRYVADFMQRTGLLQQFRFATFKDEEDEEVPEPSTLLKGLDLNEEDDDYIEH